MAAILKYGNPRCKNQKFDYLMKLINRAALVGAVGSNQWWKTRCETATPQHSLCLPHYPIWNQPTTGGSGVSPTAHPQASGWSGCWWLSRRPCLLDGTLTRRLASHTSRSKVKHANKASLCSLRAWARWPVVFSPWLGRPVWLAPRSWISKSWMATRVLAGAESHSVKKLLSPRPNTEVSEPSADFCII